MSGHTQRKMDLTLKLRNRSISKSSRIREILVEGEEHGHYLPNPNQWKVRRHIIMCMPGHTLLIYTDTVIGRRADFF